MRARLILVRVALVLLLLATIELERRRHDDTIIELFPAARVRRAG